MADLQTIVGDHQAFLKNITTEIAEAGFDFADFAQMDHMCYRVSSYEAYEQKKQELQAAATLLGETQVNGRPISTFRLKQPVRYKQWRVDAIELPAPKEGTSPREGLEHVEFVLFDDLQDFLHKHDDKQFVMDAADRGINPEVGYKLPNYGVKFHLLNLTTVVYIERKLGITDVKNNA